MRPRHDAIRRYRRACKHRLREQVCRTGSRSLSPRLDIPRSTVATWKQRGLRPVVTTQAVAAARDQLLESNERLAGQVKVLAAVVRPLLAVRRASGFRLDEERLPQGVAKAGILRAVESTQAAAPT